MEQRERTMKKGATKVTAIALAPPSWHLPFAAALAKETHRKATFPQRIEPMPSR